jgi:hypothetical protein
MRGARPLWAPCCAIEPTVRNMLALGNRYATLASVPAQCDGFVGRIGGFLGTSIVTELRCALALCRVAKARDLAINAG